ncbi:MAG: DUF1638 domain-containing protein [Candidatus Adiutrix sp.]|jgi:hypothetical protein|nr:DUF1638 domain-containing protein [Candidatus Adiutrix sp.]
MAGRRAIIACSIMKTELEAVADGRSVDLYYLEQGLHSTPQAMPLRIQEKIDELAPLNHERICLGYGLCSNGILGVSGRISPLTTPRCHDCIALFLGSNQRYREMFRKNPGTYYLTTGWIAESDDPLTAVEGRYAERLGLKKARRAMELELANYTHFCFIDNGLGDRAAVRARTLENCRAFQKQYAEVQGDLAYFRSLAAPEIPENSDAFITLPAGSALTEAMFYQVGEPGIF